MNKKIKEDLDIFKLLALTWEHLSILRKRQIKFLLILTIFNSFTEILSLSSLIPFLGALVNPDLLQKNFFVKNLVIFLGLEAKEEFILALTIIFLIAILISSFTRYIFNFYTLEIASNIGSDLSINLYKYSLYRPYSYYLSNNSNIIISAISRDITDIIYYIFNPIFHLISSLVISLTLITCLLFVNFSLTIYAFLLLIIVYLLFFKKTSVQIKRISKRNVLLTQNLVKLVQESFGSIRDVIISSRQEFFINKYAFEDRTLRTGEALGNFLSLSPKLIIEPIGIILIAFMGYFLVRVGNEKM